MRRTERTQTETSELSVLAGILVVCTSACELRARKERDTELQYMCTVHAVREQSLTHGRRLQQLREDI